MPTEDSDCCGDRGDIWLLPRTLAGRRGLLACAAVAPLLGQPRAANATVFAALVQDIEVQQIPGLPIYYVLGHPGVPSAANQGHTSNAGFVVTDDGVVVFDALGTPSLGHALLRKIREITSKPVKCIIASHYHADHIYGLQAFREETDAVIIAQAKALDYTAEGNTDDEAAAPRLAQRREALSPWVDANTRIVLPTLAFQTGSELRLGGHQFQMVYAGPAHSMSDIMMLVLPEHVLFAGDIVQNGRIPFMASAAVNSVNWLAALKKVSDLQPRFILPGHGRPHASAAEAISFTDTYIRTMRRIMGEAVANWVEFDEAYRAADWSNYQSLPAFSASNRGNAYRIYLDLEAEALAAGDGAKPAP